MYRLLILCFLIITTVSFHSFSQRVAVYNIVPSQCETGDQCLIEIDIDKWDISGLARLHHAIPENITIEVINDAGADVIIEKQRITFIWIRLPGKNELTPSYKLRFPRNMKGKVDIGEGEFSYIVDNKIQKISLKPSGLYINTAPPPQTIASKETLTEKQKKDLPESMAKGVKPGEKQDSDKEKVDQTKKEAEKEQETETDNIEKKADTEEKNDDIATKDDRVVIEESDIKEEKPEQESKDIAEEFKSISEEESKDNKDHITDKKHTGEYYRVQFSALRNYTEKEILKKSFGIDGRVYHEFDDQWHRYTFGHFKTRSEASSAAKAFSDRTGRSTFVVRYKDEKRI